MFRGAWQLSTSGQVVATGNVHKAAALFDAHLWFLGQAEASGKSASGL